MLLTFYESIKLEQAKLSEVHAVVLIHRFSLYTVLTLFALVALVASPGFCEDPVPTDVRQVVVIGNALIYKDDAASAREHAVARGLIAAVERAVADLLPIESLVGSFQTLNQTVFGDSDAFIQGFKVLAENVTGKQYRVLIQAGVSTSKITEKLSQAGMAVGSQRLPAILVAVAEQHVEEDLPRYWWVEGPIPDLLPLEQAMADSLAAVGLPILDPMTMDPRARAAAFGQPAKLTAEAAVRMGGMFKADVVIVGMAGVVAAENTMGADIRTFRATVKARALRVDTGEVIAETAQQAVAAHGDPAEGSRQALASAGLQAGRALARQITVAWRNQEKTNTDIEVVVEGTRDLGNFVMFRRSIKNTFGVREVQTRTMRPDQATMAVVFQGGAKALADLLMLNTFERFHVNIYEVAPAHLSVRLFAKEE
ncbi:MAG: hypothetical protein JEZ11_13520 [Desulfobacterales bacterium]|nr:hypothetical protein [Desulfobacterales bacterium]